MNLTDTLCLATVWRVTRGQQHPPTPSSFLSPRCLQSVRVSSADRLVWERTPGLTKCVGVLESRMVDLPWTSSRGHWNGRYCGQREPSLAPCARAEFTVLIAFISTMMKTKEGR